MAAALGGGGAGIAAGVIGGGWLGGFLGNMLEAKDKTRQAQTTQTALESQPSGRASARGQSRQRSHRLGDCDPNVPECAGSVLPGVHPDGHHRRPTASRVRDRVPTGRRHLKDRQLAPMPERFRPVGQGRLRVRRSCCCRPASLSLRTRRGPDAPSDSASRHTALSRRQIGTGTDASTAKSSIAGRWRFSISST